jgi:prevent-host-death family protein
MNGSRAGGGQGFAAARLSDYSNQMRRIAAVAELKAQLSRFLRRVKAGDEVLVTEHGVPVARIVPIDPASETVEGVRDLERQGLVRLGSGRLPDGLFRLRRGSDPKARVRRALSEDRDESS